MSAGVNISGFLAGLRQVAERHLAAATKATTQFAAVAVVGEAQEGAPVDTGALAASGTWEDASIEGDFIKAEVGFNTDYAAAVHETWQGRKPEVVEAPKGKKRKGKKVKKPRVKGSNPMARVKFLEMALRENAPKFGPYVADAIRRSDQGNPPPAGVATEVT